MFAICVVSSGFCLLLFCWCGSIRVRTRVWVYVRIYAVEVAFESIYVSGPEPAERRQPHIHLLKWFGFEPVETALCVHRGFDETGLAQHAQVL